MVEIWKANGTHKGRQECVQITFEKLMNLKRGTEVEKPPSPCRPFNAIVI